MFMKHLCSRLSFKKKIVCIDKVKHVTVFAFVTIYNMLGPTVVQYIGSYDCTQCWVIQLYNMLGHTIVQYVGSYNCDSFLRTKYRQEFSEQNK